MTRPELLTAEEEIALGRRVRAWLDDGGDPADGIAARNELVERNLALVLFVCKRYFRNKPLRWDEADQDGAMGLMRAAEKFDPSKGFRFATYAIPWIRQFIFRGLVTDRPIYIPLRYVDGHGSAYEGKPEHADAQRARSVSSLSPLVEAGWDEAWPEREDVPFVADEVVGLLLGSANLSERQADCLSAYYGLGREAEDGQVTAARLGYGDRRGPAFARCRAMDKIRGVAAADPGLRDMVRFVLGKVVI